MYNNKDLELIQNYKFDINELTNIDFKKPFKKHKATEYKLVNRQCKFYHYKQAGFFTYVLHQLRHRTPEWIEKFNAWKEKNNVELTNEMAGDIVNKMENKYTFDFITTTPKRYDRKDYHPSTELAIRVGELLGIEFRVK